MKIGAFDSFAPIHLIHRISQPAPPSEPPCGSLSLLVPKSRFALRANLLLLLIRAIPRRLTLRAASSSLPRDRPAARVCTLAPVLGCGSQNDFAVNDFARKERQRQESLAPYLALAQNLIHSVALEKFLCSKGS